MGCAEVEMVSAGDPKYFKSASEERREVYVTCIIFASAAHKIIRISWNILPPCRIYAKGAPTKY